MAPSPTNLQIIGDELAIAWSDGGESYLKLEPLRKHCPCAACGGEPDLLHPAVRPPASYGAKSFLLKEARIVGGYALQPVWGDGHDTGLYAYPFLRKLGDALAHS